MNYLFDKIISYMHCGTSYGSYIVSDYALLNVIDVRYIFSRPNSSLAPETRQNGS